MKKWIVIGALACAVGCFLLSCATADWYNVEWNEMTFRSARTLGPKLNTPDEQGHLALVSAIGDISANQIEQLIEAGADAALADASGRTPLMAAMGDWLSIYKWNTKREAIEKSRELDATIGILLRHGADCSFITTVDYTWWGKCEETPLVHALLLGDPRLVQLCLANGARVEDPRLTYSALEAACMTDSDVPTITAILARSADITRKSGELEMTALHHAARWSSHPEVIENLVRKGLPVDATDKRGDTPLFFAMFNRNPRILCALKRLGADVNHRNSLGDTPLLYAANARFYEPRLFEFNGAEFAAAEVNVGLLAGFGADIHYGEPLVRAVGTLSDPQIARGLMNAGCSPMLTRDSYKFTGVGRIWFDLDFTRNATKDPKDGTLWRVYTDGKEKVRVQQPRQIGELIDVLIQTSMGWYEASSSDRAAVKKSVKALDQLYRGTTAIMGVAQTASAEDLRKAFGNLGGQFAINANLTDLDVTALMFAAASNADAGMIDLFVKAGADPTRISKQGFSAFTFALATNPNIEVARHLLAQGVVVDVNDAGQARDEARARLAIEAWMLLNAELTDAASITKLVDSSPIINARRKSDGRTILNILAGVGDDPKLISTLLAKGADVSLADGAGKTPLMNAIGNRNGKIFAVLLDADRKLDAISREGKTVFDYAQENPAFRNSPMYAVLMKRFRG